MVDLTGLILLVLNLFLKNVRKHLQLDFFVADVLLYHGCLVLNFCELLLCCLAVGRLHVIIVRVVGFFFYGVGRLTRITQLRFNLVMKILQLFVEVLICCVAAFES